MPPEWCSAFFNYNIIRTKETSGFFPGSLWTLLLNHARPHFAQKRTKRSNGSAPKAQNYAGREMRVRTLHKNALSGATGALAKHKNTLGKQNAPELCTKPH